MHTLSTSAIEKQSSGLGAASHKNRCSLKASAAGGVLLEDLPTMTTIYTTFDIIRCQWIFDGSWIEFGSIVTTKLGAKRGQVGPKSVQEGFQTDVQSHPPGKKSCRNAQACVMLCKPGESGSLQPSMSNERQLLEGSDGSGFDNHLLASFHLSLHIVCS